MLTLLLLRHAKSSWDDPALDDFDRSLNKRGTKSATAIGRYLAREKLAPDLVLCSSAVRTRATLSLLLSELPKGAPPVHYSQQLYLAAPDAILEEIRRHAGSAARVMVVGHNPGMHALALSLAGDGERRALSELAMKYPTAGLAVITFEADDWSQIRAAGGRLERFVTPRGLP